MVTQTFTHYAPLIIHDLKKAFNFSQNDACAIVGNAGHESGGFDELHQLNDKNPGAGLGLFQWSGVRHEKFVAFCAAEKITPVEIRSSVLFLIHELATDYHSVVGQVKAEPSLMAKVAAFERFYEAAGVPALSSRYRWACAAQDLPLAAKGLA